MDHHHVLSLPFGDERTQVLDMDMFTNLGAIPVFSVEKRALDDDDPRVDKILMEQEWRRLGIAGVGDDGNVNGSCDFRAREPKVADSILGERHVLITQLVASFEERIPKTWYGVARLVGAQEQVGLHLGDVPGVHADDFMGGLLALQIDPRPHHGTQRFSHLSWAITLPGGEFLKESLAKVVWESRHMIHVGVGECDNSSREHGPWTEADIKDNIEFRNPNRGLFAGYRDTLHAIGRQVQKAKLSLAGGLFGGHGRAANVELRVGGLPIVAVVGSEKTQENTLHKGDHNGSFLQHIAPMSYSGPNHGLPRIVSLYADDPEIKEIVEEFVTEMPTRIDVGHRAFMRGDLLRLHFWAHQLKGGASGYGFPEISHKAADLEDAIVKKRSLDDVFQALLDVVDLCERASST